MSIHDTIKDIKRRREDELYQKAFKIFEPIKLEGHEERIPTREGKYIFWENMLFRISKLSKIVRCFICPKCNTERTLGAVFDDRAGLINAAMQDEDCFYCSSDTLESLVRDIVQEALDDR